MEVAAGILGFIYLVLSPVIAFLILKNSHNSIASYGCFFAVLSSLFLSLLIYQKFQKQKITSQSARLP